MDWLTPSNAEFMRCYACGQTIPPTAKLATRTITREQAQVLGIENCDTNTVTLCLNCRIRLAELSR
jgi:hypothetical protein